MSGINNPSLSSFPVANSAGGTSDAITATYSPAITLSDLTLVAVVHTAANTTTTPTFAPNGLTAHTITARGGAALAVGDIAGAGFVGMYEYNLANTRWELLNPATAANATNAANIAITDDTSTNATMYPTWGTANTGNLPLKVSSTQVTFNPSTGLYTSPAFNASTGATGYQINGVNGISFPAVDSGANNTIAIGKSALANLSASSAAYFNTAIGEAAMGNSAGKMTTASVRNVAVGSLALAVVTTGDNNVAIGHIAAGANATTIAQSAFVGSNSGRYRQTGAGNTAFGYLSLGGDSATPGNNSGARNTGLGWTAGGIVSTGSDNTMVGYNAGSTTTTGSSNIIIGSGITASSASASNELNIGGAIKATGLGSTNAVSITGALSATGLTVTSGTSGIATFGDTTSYGALSSGGGGATVYLNGATRGGTANGATASGAVVIATNETVMFSNANVNSFKMVINSSGNVGIGTTNPKAQFQIGTGFAFDGSSGGASFGNNFYNSSGWKYISTAQASLMQASGDIDFYTAASGTADAAISWGSSKVRIQNDGKVGIGTTSPASLLHVAGAGQFGTAGSVLGSAKFCGNTSGTVTVQPAAAAGTWTLTLPTDDGASGQFLTTDGSGVTSWASAGGFTLGTAQASTSGASITFSSIPSGTKVVHMMFKDVSIDNSGGQEIIMRLGDSGGIETTGYAGGTALISNSNTTQTNRSTTGMFIGTVLGGSVTYSGVITLSLENSSANTWVASGSLGDYGGQRVCVSGYYKSLSAVLTQIELSMSGSGVFDAGEINISYTG